MERTILLSDLNSFYASVECLYDPSLRDKPVSVCGSQEQRHGIVLASNLIAKQYGIKTAEGTWEALKKCPNLVIVPPHMDRYVRFSKMAREIYSEYSPFVEPFGLDECYIDVTGTEHLFGNGEKVAQTIRKRIKNELGISVSIGVSFTKSFAKLGSDLKKPDACTVIKKQNYKDIVWPLPVSDLLYVGQSTTKSLRAVGINTIGQLAKSDPKFLKRRLGVNGIGLWRSANGMDDSFVSESGTKSVVKSIGNSTTTPKDLTTPEEIRVTTMLLAESVAERLRDAKLKCRTVQIWIRSADLSGIQRQAQLPIPSCTAHRIGNMATEIILNNWHYGDRIRSLGVRACNLDMDEFPQFSLYKEIQEEHHQEDLERAMQDIRRRFGHFSIQRGIMLSQNELSNLDTRDEASHQSIAFFHG